MSRKISQTSAPSTIKARASVGLGGVRGAMRVPSHPSGKSVVPLSVSPL